MRRVGQTRRRDANEKPIVEALRAVGADVTLVSGEGAPDLLVRFHGRVVGLEVKGNAGSRTEAQTRSRWPIVRSVEEAFREVGISSGRPPGAGRSPKVKG